MKDVAASIKIKGISKDKLRRLIYYGCNRYVWIDIFENIIEGDINFFIMDATTLIQISKDVDFIESNWQELIDRGVRNIEADYRNFGYSYFIETKGKEYFVCKTLEEFFERLKKQHERRLKMQGLEKLLEEILEAFNEFSVDARLALKEERKTAARLRARQSRVISSKIDKLLLNWRKETIKAFK